MGYTTEFKGHFTVTPALSTMQVEYLKAFSESRRMRRNANMVAVMPDDRRKAVGLPVGVEGGYYVGAADDGNFGQNQSSSIIGYNEPPRGQPGLWCKWIPSDDGTRIEWDGAEKFYDYTEWLQYLIDHFLKPWGYDLSGSVKWQGEERGDVGTLTVKDNVVSARAR